MKYLGIDWATRTHVVALLDEEGETLWVRSVSHSWDAISALMQELIEDVGLGGVVVGIEAGSVRVTSAFVSAGFELYELNPKQSDRFRDRLCPAGAKDDRRDALVLASAVRTDRRWLRRATLSDELTRELRVRCRARLALVAERKRLVQQLGQVLRESYPAILAVKRPLSSAFVLDLLHSYPDARAARRAQRRRLATLLRRHHIRRLDVEQLRALLREKHFPISVGETRAHVDHAQCLARSIEAANTSLEETDAAIAALFAEHPDREIYMSLPGIGVHLAPYLASEIATAIGPQPAAGALQAVAGTCPRTRRSGTQRHGQVTMRKQCHRGLQAALYLVARCSRAASPWAASYCAWQRERSVRGNTALRALSNKWVKVLCALLANRTLYDEEQHAALLRQRGVAWAPAVKAEEGVAA